MEIFILLLFYISSCTSIDEPTISVTTRDYYNLEMEGVGVIDLRNKTQKHMMLEAVYDICYYYNTCNGNLSIPSDFEEIFGCCVPCDCDEGCFKRGTCCRDQEFELNMAFGTPSQAEVCTAVQKLGLNILAEEEYLLVSHCHYDFQGESKDKCINPEPQTIRDIAPVFSVNTGKHYRNIDCAICNFDEDSYSLWQAEINCQEEQFLYGGLTKTNPETVDNILTDKNCSLKFASPFAVQKCYLTDDVSCSRWYDDQICDTFMNRTRQIIALEDNIFRHECILPRYVFDHYMYDPSFVTFTALIDINLLVEVKSGAIKKQNVCRDQKTFLKETNSCVELACSPIYKLVSQIPLKCVNIFQQANSICFELRIKLYTNRNSTVIDNPFYALRQLFLANNTLASIHEMNLVNTSLTSTEIAMHYSLGGLVYGSIPELKSYYEHTMIRLREKIHPSVTIEFDIVDISYDSLPERHLNFLKFRNSQVHECAAIALTKLQFCSMVNLAPPEYSVKDGVVETEDGRVFHPYEYVTRTTNNNNVSYVQVCLDDYIARFNGTGFSNTVASIYILKLVLSLHFLQYIDGT